jgi:hypothetical protein
LDLAKASGIVIPPALEQQSIEEDRAYGLGIISSIIETVLISEASVDNEGKLSKCLAALKSLAKDDSDLLTDNLYNQLISLLSKDSYPRCRLTLCEIITSVTRHTY